MNIDERCYRYQPAQNQLGDLRIKAAKFDALSSEIRRQKHEFESTFLAEELAEMPEYAAICELNEELG